MTRQISFINGTRFLVIALLLGLLFAFLLFFGLVMIFLPDKQADRPPVLGQNFYEISAEGREWIIHNSDVLINLDEKQIFFIAKDKKSGEEIQASIRYVDWQRGFVNAKIRQGIKEALASSKPAN